MSDDDAQVFSSTLSAVLSHLSIEVRNGIMLFQHEGNTPAGIPHRALYVIEVKDTLGVILQLPTTYSARKLWPHVGYIVVGRFFEAFVDALDANNVLFELWLDGKCGPCLIDPTASNSIRARFESPGK